MANDETFQILASPADRWRLAVFLCRDELRFKGRQRRAALSAFKRTLGLDVPTAAFLSGKPGRFNLAMDFGTRNVFTISEEKAAFFLECVDQVELSGAQLGQIQPIISQIEAKAPSGDVESCTPFNEHAEDWTPSIHPILESAERFAEVLGEVFKAADGNFARATELYLKELEPVTDQKSKVGGRLAAPGQQPQA